jgi:hypothetical protein
VIRFSAALVAVAIGVLIGGIATSKLLLVYIAIVVSAVALLALAIGVVVKREELFGEGQGLVPAGAGAAPVLPASAGESQDQHRIAANQYGPAVSVPPSAPFQGPTASHGTAFDGTGFGGTAQGAPPVTAAPPPAASPSAPHQASDRQGRDRGADPVPSWDAQSARDQWSSVPWQGSTAADPAPDWMPSGRGASDPASQAEATAPSPTSPVSAAPPPPPSPSSPSSPPSAGPGATPPSPSGAGAGPAPTNWFAPQGRPADAAPPATEAPAGAADEEDDWPTRYSWLDDEPGEGDAADDQPAGIAVGHDAHHPVPEASAPASPADDPAPDSAAGDAPTSDAPTSDTPAGDTLASHTLESDVRAGGAPAGDTVPAEATVPAAAYAESEPEPAEPAAADEPEPGPAEPAAADAGPEPGPAKPETTGTADEPPSAGQAEPAQAAVMVTVLPGVPRYHQPDCVLIRFMSDDDIQRLTVAQAKADGCTPCAACQPAE